MHSERGRVRVSLLLSLWLGLASTSGACGKRETPGKTSAIASASVGNAPSPSIVVRDDSTGLTFSYITLDGGFQLTQKVADVPYEARDVVRVWSEVSGDGVAGPWVYVADLRTKLGDGTYKIETMARAEFDKLAEQRREKNRATKAAEKGTPSTGSAGADKGSEGRPSGKKGALTVIVYGAEWCKPCHAAQNHLKAKGIAFVHKDIEEDPGAREEMADKLANAGIRTHSIPVIDVGGKILVGFDPSALDRAVAEASRG